MTGNRGKWMISALKRPDRPKRAHLMCNDRQTFCGRTLLNARMADELGEWDPADHPDIVCPTCLEWYTNMRPHQPASTRINPQNPFIP